MRYSLLVLSNPTSGHGNRSAAAFARALLARGHAIHRVFFLDEGARAGNAQAVPPQDEYDAVADWQALQRDAGLELVLCVSSAVRRGVLDAGEAQRYERGAPSMASGFEIGGLGQLIDACIRSDRLVTFGG